MVRAGRDIMDKASGENGVVTPAHFYPMLSDNGRTRTIDAIDMRSCHLVKMRAQFARGFQQEKIDMAVAGW